MKMKLWKISQTVNEDYDTFDSAIVAAMTKEEARNIHPSGGVDWSLDSWCCAEAVSVSFVGNAKKGTKKGVVLASFNAG